MHLYALVRALSTRTRATHPPAQQHVRPAVQRILDAMTAPAIVRNGRLDILATNQLGRGLYSEMYVDSDQSLNYARFTFLNPRSATFFVDWERLASDSVALLRAETARAPDDQALFDLIDELSMHSEAFRALWATRDVVLKCATSKRMHHPIVGDLSLTFEAMEFSADPGLMLIAYAAEPGSPSEDALKLLASGATTSRH